MRTKCVVEIGDIFFELKTISDFDWMKYIDVELE